MHSDQKTLARFWAKVNKNSGHTSAHCRELGECWVWTASLNSRGYGQFSPRRGIIVVAHRFAFESEYGPLGDLECCHKCDNRRCARPSHLFKGTRRDNFRDAAEKGHFAGERNGGAKLTTAEVTRMRELYATGRFTQEVLGKRFGVCRTAVNLIINRKRWKEMKACLDSHEYKDATRTNGSTK